MRFWIVALTVAWSLGALTLPVKAQLCDCDIDGEKVQAYDRLLQLDPYTRAGVIAAHFPWGLPVNSLGTDNEVLLVQQHYILNYDKDVLVLLWAGYRLTADDLSTARERLECFRRDIRLAPPDTARCADYDEPSGIQPRYDRGHLVPNADMERSEAAMINTYMLSNMTPQHDRFNRFNGGMWFHLEARVRDWARAKGVVYILTGAIFDRTGPGGVPDEQRDADTEAARVPTATGGARVAIPTHFYTQNRHLVELR